MDFDALYTRELIPEAEVEAILDHFEATLWFLTHHPHEPLRNVKLINVKEMQLLIHNPGPVIGSTHSAAQNVHSLIEAQAQATPHRIAVRHIVTNSLLISDVLLSS